MKSIINKMLPAFIAMACVAGTANAQQLKTDESAASQFIQNKVPGLLYSTQPAAKNTAVKPHVSTIDQMKNDGIPNVPMAKDGAPEAHSGKATPPPSGPLASDAKAELPATKKTEIKMPEMQGGIQLTETEIKQPAKVIVSSPGEVKAAE
jgi:hypothetical protein